MQKGDSLPFATLLGLDDGTVSAELGGLRQMTVIMMDANLWNRHGTIEAEFIAGVYANLSSYCSQLAKERARTRGATDFRAYVDNEYQYLRDWGAVQGVGLPSTPGPADTELWSTVSKGKRVVLKIAAKSFAASGFFSSSSGDGSVLAPRLKDYVDRVASWAGETHLLLIVFWPNGSPATVDPFAFSACRGAVVHYRLGESAAEPLWVDLEDADIGWFTWLASTPMSANGRYAHCLSVLSSRPELGAINGVLRLKDLASRLALPIPIVRELIRVLCRKHRREYALKCRNNTEYVQKLGTR